MRHLTPNLTKYENMAVMAVEPSLYSLRALTAACPLCKFTASDVTIGFASDVTIGFALVLFVVFSFEKWHWRTTGNFFVNPVSVCSKVKNVCDIWPGRLSRFKAVMA